MFRILMIGYIALPALAVIGAARNGVAVPAAGSQLASTTAESATATTCSCGECDPGCDCCDGATCSCPKCVCSGCESGTCGDRAVALVAARTTAADSETPACCMLREVSIVAATRCCASGICNGETDLMVDNATAPPAVAAAPVIASATPAAAVTLASTTGELAEVAEITSGMTAEQPATAAMAGCACGQCEEKCACCDDEECGCDVCVCQMCAAK